MVKAGTQVHNARNQFNDYEEDFKELLEGEQDPNDLVEDHDIEPNTGEYRHAYESAAQITLRYRTLDRQIKAISQIMEENGIRGLETQINEQHPWYEEPEDAEGFQKASNM